MAALLPSPFFAPSCIVKKKKEEGDGVVAVAFFPGLRCNAAKEEEEEGDGNNAAIAFLRCNVAKQQQEGDGSKAVPFFFALFCAAKKERKKVTVLLSLPTSLGCTATQQKKKKKKAMLPLPSLL